jgi:sarcosine oxidase
MSEVYDVIVAGVGAMGSATCYQLAKRGQRVLGLERFDIGHGMGSSHGLTRIIRLAYFEGSRYVPVVLRARDLWRETEQAAGEKLLFVTGALDIAPEGEGIVEAALRSSIEHGLAHEVLDRSAIEKRHPAFTLPPRHIALFQPDSGFVASERAILAQTRLALASGAVIRAREAMLDFAPTPGGGVSVRTARGRYEAGALVLSTGAWMAKFVPALAASTRVVRQTQGWFAASRPDELALGRFPVFTLKVDEGHFFGFPIWDHPGFKLGGPHYGGDPFDPDEPTREPRPGQEEALRTCLARYVPAALGPTLALRACLYTMVADEDFVIDRLLDHPQIVVASPCSGHGFKFASVIGEILADLALGKASRLDLSPFALSRLGSPK